MAPESTERPLEGSPLSERVVTGRDIEDLRPRNGNPEIRTFKNVQDFLSCSREITDVGQRTRSIEGKKRFIEMLGYPEWHMMTTDEQGIAIGVAGTTIRRWMIQVPDSVLAESLKLSRERHARMSFEVDSSLMIECKKGNVKAMDLYYRRVEGWVPKQDMELSRGRDKNLESKTNLELMKELLSSMSPEERAELGIKSQETPVLDVPGVVETGESEGEKSA